MENSSSSHARSGRHLDLLIVTTALVHDLHLISDDHSPLGRRAAALEIDSSVSESAGNPNRGLPAAISIGMAKGRSSFFLASGSENRALAIQLQEWIDDAYVGEHLPV
jgi:hypothetical protein